MNAIQAPQAFTMSEQRSNFGPSARDQPNLLDQAVGQIESLQLELDALRDQLAQANRLETLGVLSAGLAHETNNLLTPIGSYAQLALGDPDNSELAERALRIAVDGVAKISRLNATSLGLLSSKTEQADSECSADDVVNETVQLMNPLLQRERVSIEVEVPSCNVKMDSLALQQVLINLINNARHALRTTNACKRIEIIAMKNMAFLDLRVRDSGPGIPETIKEQLFDAFATMPHESVSRDNAKSLEDGPDTSLATRHEAQPGSGLGLGICKRLIESAGGRITLDPTEADQGASFRIELPILCDSNG